MMLWIGIALTIALAIWFAGAWYVRGPNLRNFDVVDDAQAPASRRRFSAGAIQNDEHRAVITSLGGITTTLKGTPRRKHLALLRDYMDNMFAHRSFNAQFIPADAGGVPAEWVLAPPHALHPWRRLDDGQPAQPPPHYHPVCRNHGRCRTGDRLPVNARALAHGRY